MAARDVVCVLVEFPAKRSKISNPGAVYLSDRSERKPTSYKFQGRYQAIYT
jgi:hypothetical protein